MKHKAKVTIKVEDVLPNRLKKGHRAIDKFLAEMVNEPVLIPTPERRFLGLDALIHPTKFEFFAIKGEDGLDYLAKKPSSDFQPWERARFLDRHFRIVPWVTWHRWPPPVPGLEESPTDALVHRLSDRPVTVAVIRRHEFSCGSDGSPEVVEGLPSFYRLKWSLWWRRIDPMKDAKLRAILEGAVALDALAGREP